MKISIITSVYKNVATIEDAIKFVLSQTYTNIEYIVIKEFYNKYDLKFEIAPYYDFMHGVIYKYKIFTIYLQKFLYKIRVGGISNRDLRGIIY